MASLLAAVADDGAMIFWKGGGGTMMFLALSTTMFIVDKNSIKYGLPTNIIPQEGSGGMKN